MLICFALISPCDTNTVTEDSMQNEHLYELAHLAEFLNSLEESRPGVHMARIYTPDGYVWGVHVDDGHPFYETVMNEGEPGEWYGPSKSQRNVTMRLGGVLARAHEMKETP